MNKEKLNSIANTLSTPPKGILAADESSNTITKRLIQSMQNQITKIEENIENYYSLQKI